MNSPECYHKFILLEILQKQATSYYKRLQKRGGEGVGEGVQETFDFLRGIQRLSSKTANLLKEF